MKKLTDTLGAVKSVFVALTETGFALVAFIVLIYLLLGEDSGPYVISVVANITLLINAVTAQAMVAIALVLAIVYLMRRKT